MPDASSSEPELQQGGTTGRPKWMRARCSMDYKHYWPGRDWGLLAIKITI